MKKLILILLSLFTFAGASQKFILSTNEGDLKEEKKIVKVDLSKALVFNETKLNDPYKEYKTLARRQEEVTLQYTCTLSSSHWIKEDIIVLEGQKEILIKNVPIHFSSFRYHAV